jgi:FAD:protein FMN transferase
MSRNAPRDDHGRHRVEHIMGMPVGVDIRDTGLDPEIFDQVYDWFREVDSVFSTYSPDTEVSLLNRGKMTPEEAHIDVRNVLELCEQLRMETQGYFDIETNELPLALTTASGALISTGIDPSGLVKGWSVDRAAKILDAAGARNYSINAGGDVRVCGGALPEPIWRIGIQHPRERDKVAAVVAASDLAIATSGEYVRGRHIRNPHTGQPPAGVQSVTIVGPDLARADAYATAAFAMGEDGPVWTSELVGYEAMTILVDDRVLTTRWFPRG